MRLLILLVLLVLGSAFLFGPRSLDLTETPTVVRNQVDIRANQAVGCWDFHTAFGSSWFIPSPHWRVRLDTTELHHDVGQLLLQVRFDSLALALVPTWRPIRLAHWVPYPHSDRVFVFWGDGFSGLAMKLRRVGDRMRGWSGSTTDYGGPGWGPRVTAERVSCDSTPWISP